MKEKIKVLILEDLPSDAELAEREVKTVLNNYTLVVTDTEQGFVNALENFKPDLVISDYMLPAFNGLEALQIIRKKEEFIPFIILTGSMNEETAVECMKAGADDYVIKESIQRLGSAILSALDKKKIRKERKQAEENFRNSIDESPLGIRIVNQAGKTIYINKVLLGFYEYASLNEFITTKAKERYTEQSYLEHLERKTLRQEGGDIFSYEISLRRKDGEIRHLKVWRKEVIWNGEKHFQVINQDITELKQLNADLILAKEKAEESNRLKTAFLNNMSHEIRTPLNGITGFIGLLQDTEVDDEQKQQYFDIINKSSERLIATVSDIMDISRIEAGEVKISKSEVSVNDILEEQFKFFYHQAKAKGLDLIYKPCLTDEEACFITDKHKLEGILTNLIKNAIKFTDKGEISFACSRKVEQDIEVLEFYVKDTGIGIPANRINAIFNRFEQADIEDTKAHQGSGLGLAISKAYVEMLEGKISVSSDQDSGSTFTFSIPYTTRMAKERDAMGNLIEEPQVDFSNLSVIIAEDDEISVMLFDAMFSTMFAKITYTKSGQETIDTCRKNPETDLILMDIKMPDMNGYEATRQIRKFNRKVVIIAQTAYGLIGDKEKVIKAGCDDYIAKPLKQLELEELIQRCFTR